MSSLEATLGRQRGRSGANKNEFEMIL